MNIFDRNDSHTGKELDPVQYLLAIAAGFIAGIINTLAGSGSLFTLPFLLFMGLPAHHANGTNRVGILTQTLVGAITLNRKGHFKSRSDAVYILPTVAGSFLGAFIAVEIPEETMRLAIGIIMLLLLGILLFNYSNLLHVTDEPVTREKKIAAFPVLFFIGVYGGFIQLGVGIFTLAALLLMLNMTFRHANALKNIMNFFLTLPAFLIFAWKGHIVWEIGIVVAIGQTIGAWVAARYATDNKNASVWIRRLLVVMTFFTALKLLNVI